MSATLPNIAELGMWLRAAVYERSFRPVPLVEFVKVGDFVYNTEGEIVRKLSSRVKHDQDQLAELCDEVLPDGSVLVFCPSKKSCETTARSIASVLKAQRGVKVCILLYRFKCCSFFLERTADHGSGKAEHLPSARQSRGHFPLYNSCRRSVSSFWYIFIMISCIITDRIDYGGACNH